MFGTGRRGREQRVNIWPGYVDALGALLLVFVFMLTVFLIAQVYLSGALSEREDVLAELRADLQHLGEMLALERTERERLEEALEETGALLTATLGQRDEARRRAEALAAERATLAARLAEREEELAASEEELEALEATLAARAEEAEALEAEIAEREAEVERLARARTRAEEELAVEEELTARQRAQIEALHRELVAVREQLTMVARALDIAEATAAAQRAEIEDLGERLNIALVQRVEELERYRSEFFGRLREVLGEHPDITIQGDRFRFQSELFFATASAQIGEDGRRQLDRLAETILDLQGRIPDDIEWVIQVEGHTDKRPIATRRFPSNWELSTARAQSIVNYLIDRGVPPERLSAAGFGEYQPIAEGTDAEALAQNRRIELRLTNP